MDALPKTTGPLPTSALPPQPLTRRQESFARCVATGMSYAEAFRQSGCLASTAGGMSRQIQELKRTPGVQRRIKELKVATDEAIASTDKERVAWLRLIVSADPEELTRVVREACDLCWTDESIAAAYSAHFAPTPFDGEERAALPDVAKPREACKHCRGDGVMRVVLTPTDELSPAGRALFRGASQDKDGVIKIDKHDQVVAMDMLNKMHSSYVTRSLNMNVNAAIQTARDVDPAEALKLFDAFGS